MDSPTGSHFSCVAQDGIGGNSHAHKRGNEVHGTRRRVTTIYGYRKETLLVSSFKQLKFFSQSRTYSVHIDATTNLS